MIVTGYVDRIVFRNDENGYTVFNLVEGKKEHVCVGVIQFINEGEYAEVTGEVIIHPVYDEQIKVSFYEMKMPDDKESILRYLGSGAIKGIGVKMADRIVNAFGEETLLIIEQEPERLAEIRGISEAGAHEIALQLEEKRDMRTSMMYLQKYGISTSLAVKIYNQYGNNVRNILETNPYKLADDVGGVGFKIADEIARKIGINSDSDFRIKSGISYALMQASLEGHTYLPEIELTKRAAYLLGLDLEVSIEQHIMDLVMDNKVKVKEVDNTQIVYASNYYYTELDIARMLVDLNFKNKLDEQSFDRHIKNIEKNLNIELDEQQRVAVRESVSNGVLVVTGGPGTGKTTTINAVIEYFEHKGDNIMLAAPTGRAAKRMTETTGYEAQTIHRMLELSGGVDQDETPNKFERNEQNPLDVDVIIIDEMSMVDTFLLHSLLKAITVGTRLILVGDVDQLPSVGPGNVLKDIIKSEQFNVVMLNKIFRQAEESDIVTNAHKINKGEMVELSKSDKDFLFIGRDDASRIAGVVVTLIREKLPKYVNANMLDIQVLTPTKKGNLGTFSLNKILQRELNPEAKNKCEHIIGDVTYREGDKVMQVKNNYQIEWEKRGKYGIPVDGGVGVFNGDMGIIQKINVGMQLMEVEFDDNRYITYNFKDLEELELAYAITVHKSQGSEYPAIIMPVLSGPIMLMNRNILYTAVTRAKSCVCLVGSAQTVQTMISNEGEHKRYSGLTERIREIQQEEF